MHGKKKVLPESEVRSLLSGYGVPFPQYRVLKAGFEPKSVAGAVDLDFPIAVKVSSTHVIHKSRAGGVLLDVSGRDGLEKALIGISNRFPDSDVLVEEMVPRGLEVIVGVTEDPSFGKVIMVGLGGISANALNDVSFRALPIEEWDAISMLVDLRAKKIFETFSKEPLVDLLRKVSGFAMCHEELDQLDLNPAILYDRSLLVVDAKMVVS